MLKNITSNNKSNIIIQIARFKKYCKRWDYVLSKDSLNLLIDIYHKYPNIVAEKNVTYTVVGDEHYPYNRMEQIVSINENVWKAIRDIILYTPDYNQSMDKIGILNKAEHINTSAFYNDTNIIPF